MIAISSTVVKFSKWNKILFNIYESKNIGCVITPRYVECFTRKFS